MSLPSWSGTCFGHTGPSPAPGMRQDLPPFLPSRWLLAPLRTSPSPGSPKALFTLQPPASMSVPQHGPESSRERHRLPAPSPLPCSSPTSHTSERLALSRAFLLVCGAPHCAELVKTHVYPFSSRLHCPGQCYAQEVARICAVMFESSGGSKGCVCVCVCTRVCRGVTFSVSEEDDLI